MSLALVNLQETTRAADAALGSRDGAAGPSVAASPPEPSKTDPADSQGQTCDTPRSLKKYESDPDIPDAVFRQFAGEDEAVYRRGPHLSVGPQSRLRLEPSAGLQAVLGELEETPGN